MGDGLNTHAEILAAGAFAAFTIDLIVYPLDTIKTRMQSRDYIKTYAAEPAHSGGSSAATAAVLRRAAPSPYALRGLYQGIGSVIIATLPASSVFFTTYESAKRMIGNTLPEATGMRAPPTALVHSLSSGIAELASCLVLTPAEVIKQNAQMIQARGAADGSHSQSSVSSSVQAFRMLRNSEGGAIRRLLSGYTALAARNLPSTAIQFPIFEAMRVRLMKRWGGDDGIGPVKIREQTHELLLTGAVNGLSAGSSGAIAAVITTPIDVVKTRMMLVTDYVDVAGRRRRLGGLQIAKLVYHEHGMRGLFRGTILRAGWTFVGAGLYLGTYETAKAWLRYGREPVEYAI